MVGYSGVKTEMELEEVSFGQCIFVVFVYLIGSGYSHT